MSFINQTEGRNEAEAYLPSMTLRMDLFKGTHITSTKLWTCFLRLVSYLQKGAQDWKVPRKALKNFASLDG